MTYVTHRFYLPEDFKKELKTWVVNMGYNGLGEITYLRTYSRAKDDGTQETWHDTVIRCIEGMFSIRKNHYLTNEIPWRDEDYYTYAMEMAISMFDLQFSPPGRSLWTLGTDYVYNKGGAALQNCGYVSVKKLSKDIPWAMDMLMCGVGVGFSTYDMLPQSHTIPDRVESSSTSSILYYLDYGAATLQADRKAGLIDQDEYDRQVRNRKQIVAASKIYVVEDTREGWVDSVRMLLSCYEKNKPIPHLYYKFVRPAGEPINGFGGTSSGPEPLMKLHDRIMQYMEAFVTGETTPTRTITDLMNAVGACIVAGNVRRSAELAMGYPLDDEFLNLKNFGTEEEPGPAWDRRDIAWMSNNSVVFRNEKDFKYLPGIAQRIRDNGEPGIINLMNVQKWGRLHEERSDPAVGFNPCGEQPLESYELCNLVEVFPTRCETAEDIYRAIEYATFFASSISLLLTHDKRTNDVLSKNRRIGVSMSGIADYVGLHGRKDLINLMNYGYESIVRPTNSRLNDEARIPRAIRVTTVKPSGTISLLAGVSPGMHWPTFTYAIRRMRIAMDSPLIKPLQEAGYYFEKDVNSDNTWVFEFPIQHAATTPAPEVPLEVQAQALVDYQRFWSDNAVSCTLYFDPENESDKIEQVLETTVPYIKSLSMLPHTEQGAFAQMPYEGISESAYHEMLQNIRPMNMLHVVEKAFSDGEDSRFCSNDTCEIDFSVAAGDD